MGGVKIDTTNTQIHDQSQFVSDLLQIGGFRRLLGFPPPVSLTSVCCNVIEHIIDSHLMKFLEDQNILTDYQHGFRKKRSCESQLITTIQDLASGIDSSTQIDAILLDFSKTFDKVSHERLAATLHHNGVRGPTLNWIKIFLASRTQRVS